MNFEAFDGIFLDGSRCKRPSCEHGDGPVSAESVARIDLNHTLNYEKCDLFFAEDLLSPRMRPLTTLMQFASLMIPVESMSAFLLNKHYVSWDSNWDRVFLPLREGVSLMDLNDSWVRGRILLKQDELEADLMSILDMRPFSEQSTHVDTTNQQLVVTAPFMDGPESSLSFYFETLYSPLRSAKIMVLPERYLTSMSVAAADAKFANWRKRLDVPDSGTVWFLGKIPCQAPVKMTEEYTKAVLEIADTLLEQFTLEESLIAAVSL